MRIPVDAELYNACLDSVQKNLCSRGANDNSSGNFMQQLYGNIAENLVRRQLGIEEKIGYLDGPDAGWDIEYAGLKIDIKTTIYNEDPQPYHEYHVPIYQMRYSNDAYIWCNYNTTTDVVTVCGFISKPTFIFVRKELPKGTRKEEPNGKSYTARYTSYYVTYNELKQIDFNKK